MIKIQERSEIVAHQAESKATVCVLCSHNCGLTVAIKDNKIASVSPDKSNPITQGYSCNKAYSISHYVNHEQRMQYPLKRQDDGSYVRIEWDQAIDEIAERLNRIRQQHGEQSLALNGVGGQANHLDALYALGFLSSFGSPWFFNSYAQEKTQHQWVDRLMMKASATDMFHPDAWNSRFILMMGTNPLISNRGHNATQELRLFLNNKKNTLIVIDPRKTETARRAHAHLALKSGSDAYLLMAMLKHIVDCGLYDHEFINKHTRQFQDLRAQISRWHFESLVKRSGLSIDDVISTAEGFARAESACVFYDLGVEQIQHSTLVSWLIRVLVVTTGNFAKPGGNHFTSSFSPDTQALTAKEESATPVSGIRGIPALGPFGMYSPYLIPEEIEAGNIKALIVEGANPLLSYADTTRFKRSLQALDLLVVIDPAFTETARVADYVLPTPTGYEKWEWCTFPKAYPQIYGQLRPPVVEAPSEALPEAEIYSRLASSMNLVSPAPERLGHMAKHHTPPGIVYFLSLLSYAAVNSQWQAKRLLANAVFWCYQSLGPQLPNPALASIWINCHLFAITRRKDALRTLGKSLRWASPFKLGNTLFELIIDHPEGIELGKLDATRHFDYAVNYRDKKIRLLPDELAPLINAALAAEKSADADFPFVLCAGERTPWNANTIQRSPDWRKGKGPHFWIRINPQLASEIGAKNGEIIELSTRQGKINAPAKISDALPYGMMSIPNGFGMEYPDAKTGELKVIGQNPNLLTSLDRRDPVTGSPFLKHEPCMVQKVAIKSQHEEQISETTSVV